MVMTRAEQGTGRVSGSATCCICGRRAKVTKYETLARHRDRDGARCDNTGLTREQKERRYGRPA